MKSLRFTIYLDEEFLCLHMGRKSFNIKLSETFSSFKSLIVFDMSYSMMEDRIPAGYVLTTDPRMPAAC